MKPQKKYSETDTQEWKIVSYGGKDLSPERFNGYKTASEEARTLGGVAVRS